MDQTYYETACSLALNRIFGYEPAAARALIARTGSAGAAFQLTPEQKEEVFGPFNKFKDAVCPAAVEQACEELQAIENEGCRFVPLGSPGYPPLLADCPDAPAGLYFKGTSSPEEVFGRGDFISVVGTRDISPYGREWTERLVGAMARSATRPTIVSGLAIGVDVTAHAAALNEGLATVAVIPVGIDLIYPRRHAAIAERIAASPRSALVTDFPPGTRAVTFNFLRRNRIIAGISRATLLTESKVAGGGTMTARLAAGYGRELYALPGRVDDVRSGGCNRLVAEKLAEPVSGEADFCSQLRLGTLRKAPAAQLEESLKAWYGGAAPQDFERIVRIALLIRKQRGLTPEEIVEATGYDYGSVSATLCLLESDGIIVTDLLRRCSIASKKL